MKLLLTGASGFVGSNVAAVFTEHGATVLAPSHSELDLTDRDATLPYFYLERYIPSYLREWEVFIAAVGSGKTPPVGATDARAPLVIGLAASESLREGRPVEL